MTHQLFCVLQQHLPKQNGLLFARVGADGLQQSSLPVAEGQLDCVFTNKSRIAIHGKSSRTVSGNWEHVADAALRGLPEVVRGDQALVHGSGFRGLLCFSFWRIELCDGLDTGVACLAVADFQDRGVRSAGAIRQCLYLREIQACQISPHFLGGGDFDAHNA